jgi:kynurenine formamidase
LKEIKPERKPKVEDIINRFWIAHEILARRTGKDKKWSWEKFCDESGYHRKTPLRWFEKYGLPYTKNKMLPKVANATMV